MGNGGGGPFREKSLERLSSPERLDQLLRVVDRKSWLPLAALGALVLVLVVWSALGSVPENVEGKGILVRPREIVELQAPSAGYLHELRVAVGDAIRPGDVLAVISRPDLEKQLELQRVKLAELVEQARETAARSIADRLRERELQTVAEERDRLAEQRRIAHALEQSLQERLAGQRELQAAGLISKVELDDTELDRIEATARVAELDSALRALRSRELQIEEEYLERLRRNADREQNIADVDRQIARLEHLLENEGRVRGEQAGRLLELSVAAGEFVSPGARLGAIAVSDPAAPLLSLTYFTVRDGKRLKIGDEIRVTPDTVERQRFGSIRGVIYAISPFPVTLAEAEKNIGNAGLAETLVGGGYRIQVEAELHTDPGTPSGLDWTSSRGPEMSFSAGTTATARVAVEHRPPISFVLPFLKSAAGID